MSTRRGPRRDGGMTLIEVVVVVVLIGLLAGAVSGAIIVVFRSQNGVVATTAESHDTQQIVSYLPLDVQSGPSRASAYRAAVGGAGGARGTGCDEAGDGNVLRIDVTDRRLDIEERRIAYQLSDTAAGRRIDRHVCKWDDVALAWVLETSTNVVDLLDRDVDLATAATAEVIASGDEVVAVELSYVQRGDTEVVRAAPREEHALSTSGVCGVDPLSAAVDFDAFIEGNVHLIGTSVKSRLFVGGTLTFDGPVVVAQTGSLPEVEVPDPHRDLGLLTGSVDWAGSTGTLTVRNGKDVLVEDGLYTSDADGPVSSPDPGPTAMIDLQGGGQVLTPGSAPVIAPGTAFAALRACSDRLAELPDSCANSTCAAHVDLPDDYGGTTESPTLHLTPDLANAFNIDVGNLVQLQNLDIDFAASHQVNETTPLIINVASASGATVEFEAPVVQGSGSTTVHIIWNFPNAGLVRLLAGDGLRGTLMAPYAAVEAWADIEGGVIAQHLTMHGGSLSQERRFDGTFAW
jgi:choice-of-anchor A domain-containing protein/prepilin-type N-terminal cleavage/methylation domain-containing protein